MKRPLSDESKDTVNDDDIIQVSADIPVFSSFKSMGLRVELLKGIYNYGFTTPSMIQQRAIKQIAQGQDVVAQAQSGTGKTAAFSIGTLQQLDAGKRSVQILILSPTRELAQQTAQVITALSDHMPVRCVSCCGGRKNVPLMVKELSKGAHIVVGTPGRVLDLTRQGSLQLHSLRSIVLDEADEMLNRGLKQQIEAIFRLLPSSTQLTSDSRRPYQAVIVSATLPKDSLELVGQLTRDPIHILVPRDELSLSGLAQFYIDVGSEQWKLESLTDLFTCVCVAQTVVFVGTRAKVDWLSDQLKREGFTVSAVHGQLSQSDRELIMDSFRLGKSRILVSSDVWARGIDVQSVGLVVNYDLPASSSDYLHRIGRSGRFGRRGLAVTLLAGSGERKRLDAIGRHFATPIRPAPAKLETMMTIASSQADDIDCPVNTNKLVSKRSDDGGGGWKKKRV